MRVQKWFSWTMISLAVVASNHVQWPYHVMTYCNQKWLAHTRTVQQWLSASMCDDLMVVKYDNQSEGLEVVGVDQNKFSNSCMQPYVMILWSWHTAMRNMILYVSSSPTGGSSPNPTGGHHCILSCNLDCLCQPFQASLIPWPEVRAAHKQPSCKIINLLEWIINSF